MLSHRPKNDLWLEHLTGRAGRWLAPRARRVAVMTVLVTVLGLMERSWNGGHFTLPSTLGGWARIASFGAFVYLFNHWVPKMGVRVAEPDPPVSIAPSVRGAARSGRTDA